MAELRLEQVIEEHWQFLERSRPELLARADVTVYYLPNPTLEKAKWDAQVSRAGLAALDEVVIDALKQDSYISWLLLEWELAAMGGRVAFHWTNLSDLSPGRSVFDKSIEILKAQRFVDIHDAGRFVTLLTSVSTVARINFGGPVRKT